MEIFISSNSNDEFFINNIQDVVDEKSPQLEDLCDEQIFARHPPREWSNVNLQDKIEEIKKSDIIVMNITPTEIAYHLVINSGVLIEYGILVGSKKLRELYLFCDESIDRSEISPIFHGRDILPFSRNNQTEFKQIIDEIISEYIGKAIRERKKMVRKMGNSNRLS